MKTTKLYILAYTVAFIVAALLLSIYGYTGYVFAAAIVGLGVVWLWRGIKGFKAVDDVRWARGMFGYSLVVLLVFSAGISLSAWLP